MNRPAFAVSDRLPSLLALPFRAFADEQQSALRLHRLCDAVEILTRFLSIVALGEWRVRHDDALPPELIELIHQRKLSVERPTFGQWAGLLTLLVEQLDRTAPLVVPELPDFVIRHLLPILPGGERTAYDSLLALRNDLAHGGGITGQAADDFLRHWEPRLSDLTQQLAFLDDADVCLLADGVARRLAGPGPLPGDERPLSADLRQTLSARSLDGHVLLLRQERWLDLWPLCAFGRAGTVTPERGRQTASTDSPLVYFRAPTRRLRYVAVGAEWPFSETAGRAVEEFRRLFMLDTSQPAPTLDFEQEIEQDAAALVGRAVELKHVKELLKPAQTGVFWISGPGGIGKSFLLARLAVDLRGDPRKVCRIAWRFKVSDQNRANRVAFFRHAVTRLAEWLSQRDITPGNDAGELFGQMRRLLDEAAQRSAEKDRPPRVLFVLDGLDEIARLDTDFAQVPFLLSRPNVVWLCAGRPEGRLPEVFAPDRCTHVFPPTTENPTGGLPAMTPADIRAMLLDGTGALKYQLLPLDAERSGEVINEVVDAVGTRAAGLPLYVHFVVEDILSGHFRFAELPHRLPPSLAAYYEDLLDRLTISDLRALLTPLVVTVAWARAPLDEDLLYLLMVRRKVLTSSERGRQRLREGLDAIQGLVRQAPVPGRQQLGYEMYHPTFRDHIRRNESGKLDEQNELARQEFNELVIGWASLPAERVSARDYVLRHGVAHLLESGQRDEAVKLLLDLPFLEARAKAGLVFDLAGDFSVVAQLRPVERERRTLELLEEALRRDIHFIDRHREEYPQGLFQCVWNSGWWYDCIQASRHYVEGRSPGHDSDVGLHTLLEGWRADREQTHPGFVWVRSLRPPTMQLGTAQLHCLRGHEGGVSSVAFASDGRHIVSGSDDQTVRVWDAESGAQLLCLRRHKGEVKSVAFAPDGRRIVSGAGDKTVRVWDAESGAELHCLREHEDAVSSVAFAPDGRRIVSGSGDGTVRVWSAENGNPLRCLRGHTGRVSSVAFAPDGRRIVSGAWDDTVRIWDVESGGPLHCLRGHEGLVWSVAFAPDGGCIVSGARDNTVRVWDAERGAPLRCLRGHERSVSSVAFAPDGGHIVSGADNTVRVWDAQSGAPLRCLRGHEGWVSNVAFAPNGRRIVSGSWDKTLRVWDAECGAELLCLREYEDGVISVAFVSDGRCIVTGSVNKTVRFWDAESGECLEVKRDAADVRGIAGGARVYPFSAHWHSLETILEDTASHKAVAWFSESCYHITTHPFGRAWAGVVNNRLVLFTLEGQPPTSLTLPT